MDLSQRFVSGANFHSSGAKSGQKIGTRLSTAPKSVAAAISFVRNQPWLTGTGLTHTYATGEIRTHDRPYVNRLLYPLSYSRMSAK